MDASSRCRWHPLQRAHHGQRDRGNAGPMGRGSHRPAQRAPFPRPSPAFQANARHSPLPLRSLARHCSAA
eukprot:11937776-Heterocapsa_arctica.AAC.1